MAFECPHCRFRNNEVQSASVIAYKGMRQTCQIKTQKDLSRQVVKSENATVRFEELDFEIPSNSQKGILSTVDGILDRAIAGLQQDQEARLEQHPELHKQIEAVIAILKSYYDNQQEFTISIDDPTGNSYIVNLNAPNPKEQNEQIGLPVEDAPPEDEFDLGEQVHVFHGNCSRCNAPSETRMHMLDIPHFKEVIIMATDCDACGYKNNEVKAGGAISPFGQKITLILQDAEDLSRDILKVNILI
jgi:zinc finger protein